MNRNRAYYRHQRKRAIARKVSIRKKKWAPSLDNPNAVEWEDIRDPRRRGKFNKGKVHCSCPMCRTKSYDSLSLRDLRLLMRDKLDLREFLNSENGYQILSLRSCY